METKNILISVAVLLVVMGGGYWLLKGQTGTGQPTNQPTVSQPSVSKPTAEQQPSAQPSAEQTSKTVSFTVAGNDSAGNPTNIKVNKGDTVQITFQAQTDGTYHGGLDFRSSVVNTGTISPGSSKMVTFTATNSFAFTPYWPATNIAKPYMINVTVE